MCTDYDHISFNFVGDLPTENITEVSQSVCVQTFSMECQQSWNIDIKHCYGNFIVYNLVESQLSSSAYCFGKKYSII